MFDEHARAHAHAHAHARCTFENTGATSVPPVTPLMGNGSHAMPVWSDRDAWLARYRKPMASRLAAGRWCWSGLRQPAAPSTARAMWLYRDYESPVQPRPSCAGSHASWEHSRADGPECSVLVKRVARVLEGRTPSPWSLRPGLADAQEEFASRGLGAPPVAHPFPGGLKSLGVRRVHRCPTSSRTMAKWRSTMAGRPRKPTALLKLEGRFRRDRHGDRVQEPDAPLGGPPGHLPADARLAWRQVAGSATWLRRPDRPLVELYAQLQAAARRDFAAMSAAKLSLLAGVAGRTRPRSGRSRARSRRLCRA